jgi:L-lactate utilization protein LutB
MDLSKELAQNWTEEHLLSHQTNANQLAEDLANKLTDYEKFKSHSRHLHRGRARDIGFEIEDLEDDHELQDLILTIYHAATLTHDNQNVAKIIETHEGNSFIIGTPQRTQPSGGASIKVPDNTPPGGPPQPEDSDI